MLNERIKGKVDEMWIVWQMFVIVNRMSEEMILKEDQRVAASPST